MVVSFQELVGKFNADFYSLNGLTLESRKRREHLSEEDLQKNKAIVESFTKGGGGTSPFDEVKYCGCTLFGKYTVLP